jgi:hypothetical protein
MDLGAIAAALATRFSAPKITPPTGYNNVALATHRLPNAIVSTPTCLVFPPEGDMAYSGHKRSTNQAFPVRFYIAATSDRPRAIDALYAWYEVLVDQLEGQFDLGLSASGVTHAVILSSTAGTGEYAENEYAVVEFIVGVHIEQGHSPTSS